MSKSAQVPGGTVTSIQGRATVIPAGEGAARLLKVGDTIQTGDAVLTSAGTQLQITDPQGNPWAPRDLLLALAQANASPVPAGKQSKSLHAKVKALTGEKETSGKETDQAIQAIEQGDKDAAPAAGVDGGGNGSMTPGLRVDRVIEVVGTQEFAFGTTERIGGGTTEAAPAAAVQDTAIADAVAKLAAADDTFTTNKGVAVGLPVLSNDTIETGSGAQVVAINGQAILPGGQIVVEHGLVQMTSTGALTFAPADGYTGTQAFTYTVTNASGQTADASVTVNVVNGSNVPVPSPDLLLTKEDTPVTFLVTGNDEPGSAGPIQITAINGQSLAAGDTVAVSHGSVTLNADGTLTITPELNYAGDIGFAYTVTDQAGQSANSTVQVQVEAINDAPLVSGGTLVDVNTTEDAPVSGKVNATDPEGDALTFTQGTGPAHGSATVNGDGSWTYTPKPDFNGKDSFTVTVSDGNGGSTEVTIRVDVADVPDAPRVGTPSDPTFDVGSGNYNVTTNEDQPAKGQVTAQDPDGDPVTFGKGSDPAHGSVTVNPDGSWTYTPAKDYNGPDSFTVTVSDDNGHSTTTTINVGVIAVPDSAVFDSTGTQGAVTEDAAVNGSGQLTTGGKLVAVDPDSGTSTFQPQSGTQGAYGSFELNADGTWTYTAANGNPAIQALGNGDTLTETFTVKATDGTPATVTITINGSNDSAVISSSGTTGSVTEDAGVNGAGNLVANGTLSVTDTDAGQAGFLAGTTHGAYGDLALNADGTWTYTAANGNPAIQALGNGNTLTETFTVKSTDGTSATVTITINGSNDSAVISSSGTTGSVNEDSNVDASGNLVANGTLSATDTDAGQAGFQAGTTHGAYGDLALNADGTWTYTAANGNPAIQALGNGDTLTETFTVKAADGTPATVTITINGSNDSAVISSSGTTGSVTEDTGVNGAGNLVANGTLSVTDTDAGQAGFQAGTTHGTYGDLALNTDGTWTYTAANNNPAIQALGNGDTLTETFTVKAADGTPATVTITINGSNDSAVISSSGTTGSVTEDAGVNGAGNLVANGTLTVTDTDAGQAGFQAGTTQGAYGDLALNADGTWTYTAANGNPAIQALGSGDTLTEAFTVKSTDGTSATVTITINGSNDAAVISSSGTTGSVTEDAGVNGAGNLVTNGTLSVTDTDAGQAGFQAGTTHGAYGDLTLNADGTWNYTAANGNPAIQALGNGDTLTETFTVKSTDGTSATVTITINGSDDAAVISSSGTTGSVTEDAGVNGAGNLVANGTLSVTDTDAGQAGFLAGTTHGAYGDLALNADGTWTYTAANNNPAIQALGNGDTLTETFTVKAADGTPATVTITINGSNDSAVISSSGTTGAITEDAGVNGAGNLVANGTLSATDIDASQAGFQAGTTHGAYGDLALNADGTWTYTAANNNPAIQALGNGDTLTETFTVKAADGTPATVTITINGSNDSAVISSSGTTGAITEDAGVNGAGNLVANGTLSATDTDAGQAGFQAGTTHGAYGDLALNADGTWTYTTANNNPAIQALGNGDTLTETFTVKSTDGTSATVTITINGANDSAVISSSGTTGSVTEDTGVNGAGNLVANGTLSVTDTDAGQAGLQAGTTHGAYGDLALNANGTWTYTAANGNPAIQALGNGDTLTETFTVKATDGTPATVTITINGSNDSAVISSSGTTGSVTEDAGVNGAGNLVANGTLTVTDTDAGQAGFQAGTTHGAYGDLALNADGTWTYTAANGNPAIQALGNGDTLTETFTVKATDGTPATVTITINGSNDAAVISSSGTTGSVTEDAGVNGAGNLVANGTLTVTDTDAGQAGFQAGTTHGAYGDLALNADGTWTYTAANGNPAIQALGNGDTLTETFTVKSTDGTSATVTITINGSNDSAVISSSGTTGSVTEDAGVNGAGNLVANGTLSVTDTDAGQAGFQAGTTHGAYGDLALNADGTWTYTAANGNPAIQALGNGDTLTETFTVKATDGTPATVTITINGSNDSAVISSSGTTGSVNEDSNVDASGNLVANGTLSVTDTDAGQAGFQAGTTHGAYGDLALNADGTWTYTAANGNPAIQALGNGDTLTETFTVKAADGTPATVTITINGANDSAVISSSGTTGSVTEDAGVNGAGNLVANGTLTVTDTDAGQAGFQAGTTHGAYGDLALNANGTWTYTAANSTPAIQQLGNGQTLTETFTVKSTDGTSATVTITINGSNDAAVISSSGTTGSVTEDAGVNGAGNLVANGTLSVTDTDAGQAGFQAGTTHGAYGDLVLNANGTWTYIAGNNTPAIQQLGNGQTLTETFTVKSTDGTPATVTITINGSNDAAVISSSGTTGSVTEDTNVNGSGNLVTNGTLTVTDTDLGQAGFQAQTNKAGLYGTFNLAANGAWTYSANNGQTAIQQLGAGQTLTETFSVKSIDGTTSSVTVTIHGTNDSAVLVPTIPVGTVTEDTNVNAGKLTTGGTVVMSDIDLGQVGFQPQTNFAGTYGSFSITAGGSWTYSANNSQQAIQQLGNGQSLTESFTVRSFDGTPATVKITIMGVNDAAVISSSGTTGSVTEDQSVSGGNLITNGKLTVTDTDLGESTFQAQTNTAGKYGTFNLGTDGNWTYSANNGQSAIQQLGAGQSLSETFTVKAYDGTSSTVTVTINGTNDTPTLSCNTGSAQRYVEDTLPVQIFNQPITITDPDSSDLMGATIKLTNPQVGDILWFGIMPLGILPIAYNPLTGELTLIGKASVADYQAAIQSIYFSTPGHSPVDTDRQITLTVTDGQGTSNTISTTMGIALVNDSFVPTLSVAPVGHWTFDDAIGSITTYNRNNIAQVGSLADDSSTGGIGLPTFSSVGQRSAASGNYISFNDAGDRINISTSVTQPLMGTATMTFWLKTSMTGSGGGNGNSWDLASIIGSEQNGGGNDIQWGAINSAGKIGFGLGNVAGVFSTTSINDNVWHNVAITRNASTGLVQVFVDGKLEATGSPTDSAYTGLLNRLTSMGATNQFSNNASGSDMTDKNYYTGQLDDLHIYDRVLTADQIKAIRTVENGYQDHAIANDGGALKIAVGGSLYDHLTVTGLESGMTISDGIHTATSTGNGQSIDLTGWTLSALQITNAGTASATLAFNATSTALNGETHTTTDYLNIVNGSTIVTGTSGDDMVAATSTGASFLAGGAGQDNVVGNASNDRLLGESGDDNLSGLGGHDVLVGGAGNDLLTGGAGNDVFRWELNDGGAKNSPSVDYISDFSSTPGNKDVLDLRDLLQGDNHVGTNSGNLSNYMHFEYNGADTVIHLSSNGGFNAGYTHAQEDQTIVLRSVDLTLGGALTNDQQIIKDLLTKGQLNVD